MLSIAALQQGSSYFDFAPANSTFHRYTHCINKCLSNHNHHTHYHPHHYYYEFKGLRHPPAEAIYNDLPTATAAIQEHAKCNGYAVYRRDSRPSRVVYVCDSQRLSSLLSTQRPFARQDLLFIASSEQQQDYRLLHTRKDLYAKEGDT
jgi:hypothetical protein